jgi:hypothetical protein
MHGDDIAKLVAQRERHATRQGLSERIPYGGAALFGRLRTRIGDERLAHDLAVAIEAEPDRNLPGRSVSRRDPARAQCGANVARKLAFSGTVNQTSSRYTAMCSHPAVVRLFRISDKLLPAGPQRHIKWGTNLPRARRRFVVVLLRCANWGTIRDEMDSYGL